ncbi:MAG: thioredoxin family protein [Pirellulales bacterium]
MNALVLSVMLQVVGAGGDAPATYEQAYREAQANGRPLVVLVGADWCPGCQTMKGGVLARMMRSGKLSRVNYAVVNTDRERELAGKLMSGGSIPQLIVFSKKNATQWSRDQITGATGEDTVATMIDRAAKTADVASADGATAKK